MSFAEDALADFTRFLRWYARALQLEIVPRAIHLFEEPGAFELVSQRALTWCKKYLKGTAK